MAATQVGTVDWFKREKRNLIELAKAIDSFATAARKVQKIIELGSAADAEVQSALHDAAVVSYARPFSNNRSPDGRQKFPESVLKGGIGFDKAIHDQLLTLRDKLIAHSDSDYADGRLFDKSMVITRGQEELKVLTGVRVMTLTVHLLHDMGLAARILDHLQAAEKAAYARLEERIEEYTKAAQQFPDAYEQARVRHLPPIYAGRIELSPENPRASFSIPDLDPHTVLSPPPLQVGKDGYAYRTFAVRADLRAQVKVRTEDGGEAEFSIAERADAPAPDTEEP